MANEIYLGCEQLGGTDWGIYDIKKTIDMANVALKIGFDGFDVADCYSLGLAEERLGEVLKNSPLNINFITKGGISWKINKAQRAKTWKDTSPEYLRKAVKSSLARLKVKKIPIYLIHWTDNKTNIMSSIKELESLKKEGHIEKIGISNPSVDWLCDTNILSVIDHVQIPHNMIKPFPFPETFSSDKNKYNIKVSAYSVLSYGLLTDKYNKDHSYKYNDRRERLSLFKDENIIQLRQKYYNDAKSRKFKLEEMSIKWCRNEPIVDILIVGCKSIKQAISNLAYFHEK